MRRLTMVVLAVVGGCAPQVTAQRPCYVASQQFLRDDPEVVLRMTVANGTNEVCQVSLMASSSSHPAGKIIRAAEHGDAQLTARGAGYKPALGYTGSDEFRFSLPLYRSTFVVHVNVVQPEA